MGTLLAAILIGPIYILTRPRPNAQTWGLGEIAAILLILITALIPVTRLFIPPDQSLPPLGAIGAIAVLQNAVFVAAALYLVHVKYRLPLSSVGLSGGAWLRRLGTGAAAAVAAVAGNYLGQSVTLFALSLRMGPQRAHEFVAHEEASTPIYSILPQLHAPLDLLLLAVVVAVIAPIGEEIFFRGLTYGALRRLLPRPLAALLSALFFATSHLQFVAFLALVILGVILAYLYEYTSSLVPGMIAHGVNNLAALVLYYQGPSPNP